MYTYVCMYVGMYLSLSLYIYIYIYVVRSFDDRMRKSPPGAGYSDNSDNCLLHTADSTSCAGLERKGLTPSDR